MPQTSKTRTFICISFPDGIIKETARLQSLVKKQKFVGKLTELENLHLTLKFLGEISQEKLEKVKFTLSKISLKQFEVHLEKTGTFSYKKQPRIVWLKIAGRQIYELQKQIDEALSKEFPKEERFMSHLTIARIKYVKTPDEFKNYVEKLSVKKLSFQVKEFKLKSSELTRQGPVYTTLETYKLKE